MQELLSRENRFLKLVRSLQSKKGRVTSGLYFAEGRRIAEEALTYAREQIEAVLASDAFYEKNRDDVKKIDSSGIQVYTVPEKLFFECCDTETPQGIGVVLKTEQREIDRENARFLLVLDGVSEPGNLGTIVRTAEAAGVDGILLMKGCADLYNPKVIRSTMGSVFRIPCVSGITLPELAEWKKSGFVVTSTALSRSVPLSEAKQSEKQMLVIGSEANGVSEEVLAISDQCVRIPMSGKVESLNAAVAAGIAMYALRPGQEG